MAYWSAMPLLLNVLRIAVLGLLSKYDANLATGEAHMLIGTLLLVPMSGHAAITYSACAEQIGQEFIADPTVAPDASCLADLAPQWVMPAEEVSGGGQATP